MKRALLMLSILGLSLAGLSLMAAQRNAKAETPAPKPAVAMPDSFPKIWMSIPDCPPTDSCSNGDPLCHDSAACLSDTDLGASKCRLQSGGFFACTAGQTVHKKAGCRCIIGQGGDCASVGSYLICE
jgi:hypothetical protein